MLNSTGAPQGGRDGNVFPCHANTWQEHQMSLAVSLNVSRDFLHLWRKRPCYWFSQHVWVITQHWWLQLTWRAPAQWQPTDVKPPESDLRPTSERKTNWNERKKDRKGWSLWSARVNSSNYIIHMMQGYVQVIRGFCTFYSDWVICSYWATVIRKLVCVCTGMAGQRFSET